MDSDSSPTDDNHESLATEAGKLFNAREYEQCHVVMKKLTSQKLNDAKVIMNKALLDYAHNSNFTQTNDYVCELKRAAEIEGFVFEDRIDPDEQSNVSTQEADESHVAIPQSSLTTKSFNLRSSSAICLMYNYSLLLFYQRQYLQAERFLSRCLSIENRKDSPRHRTPRKPMTACCLEHSIVDYRNDFLLPVIDLTPSPDANLCRRILLLWLEVLLKLSMAECVFELCGTWLMCISSSSVASAAATTAKTQTQTSPEHQANTSFRHISSQALEVLGGARKPLQLFYIRACLLTGRLKSAESELNLLLTDDKPTVSDPDLSGDHGKAKDDDVSNEQDTSNGNNNNNNNNSDSQQDVVWNTGRSVQFLQAQLAYLKNQHSEALQNLSALSSTPHVSSTHQCESTLVWNNLGLIYHRAGQFNLGGVQLGRALRETDTNMRDLLPATSLDAESEPNSEDSKQLLDKVPIQLFSLSQHHALLYNFGINLLCSQRPWAAFQILVQLTDAYPQNPRLWFRLAECCMKLHCPNNLAPWQLKTRTQCRVEVTGSGPCRKLLLVDRPKPETPSTETESTSNPKPNLNFAFQALHNALSLLPRPPAKLVTSDKSDDTQHRLALLKWANKQHVLTLPNPIPLRGAGLLHLLCATHLNLAYVALCLDHPVETLRMASQLILTGSVQIASQPTEPGPDNVTGSGTTLASQRPVASFNTSGLGLIAPRAHAFLARLYYAEALIMMDRSDEALDLVRNYISYSESSSLNFSAVIQTMGGVSLRPVHLLPWSRKSATESKLYAVHAKAKLSADDLPGVSQIRPPDFPANATQSASLLLYNLAACLAIQKQYPTSEYCLDLSLPGLMLSSQQLDGRKWSRQSNALNSVAIPASPKLLPLPAILLRLYLELGQGRSKRAAQILHEFFGNSSLINRLNPLPIKSDFTSDSGSILYDLNDIQLLLKSQQLHPGNGSRLSSTGANPILKRPANLWAPNQPMFKQAFASQNSHQTYLSPMFQGQTPTQPTQQYVNRWDQSVQPNAAGLINPSNNENDWPAL